MPGPCRRPPSTCPRLAGRRRGCKRSRGGPLAEAEVLKLQARMEDLTLWEMEKVKDSRKGSKTYT
jgi:hypothetical protein